MRNLCLDGGFFVFGDLSVKVEGDFRLRFNLFEMRKYVKELVEVHDAWQEELLTREQGRSRTPEIRPFEQIFR